MARFIRNCLLDPHSRFENIFNRLIKEKKIKEFDNDFYRQFEDIYYLGLPIYYHLERLNFNRCFEVSKILGAALGKEANVYNGKLEMISKIYNMDFRHAWVEKDGYVYDTTWQIICPKKVYYRLFGVVDGFIIESKNDIKLYNKKYYQDNINEDAIRIYSVKKFEESRLKDSNISDEEKAFCLKVLMDLPDIMGQRGINITSIINKKAINR